MKRILEKLLLLLILILCIVIIVTRPSKPVVYTTEAHEKPKIERCGQFAVDCEYLVENTILYDIAECESGNTAHAKNPNSSASGRFQFIDSSWEYYGKQLWGDDFHKKDKLNWEHNTELAVYVYSLNGTQDWYPSEHCWA